MYYIVPSPSIALMYCVLPFTLKRLTQKSDRNRLVELIPSTSFRENSHKYALFCAFSEKTYSLQALRIIHETLKFLKYPNGE